MHLQGSSLEVIQFLLTMPGESSFLANFVRRIIVFFLIFPEEMPAFTHLHVHTQFSILDGASKITDLMAKAKESGMTSLAITDHGNMYGVPAFVQAARKEGIKPIIGCEVYVAAEGRHNQRGKVDRSGFHLILLAKNKQGYHNLSRLSSKGYLEGFYYTPRIDK